MATDRRDDPGIDCGNRLQIELEPGLCAFRRVLRAGELGDGGVDRPIFQITEVLAGRIGVPDCRNQPGFLREASQVADELADQKRGGAGEDRQKQDRQKDQPQANREIRHQAHFIKSFPARTKRLIIQVWSRHSPWPQGQVRRHGVT